MTSLQYLSCTTTTSSHHHPRSSSHPGFPKQSHFITHAKRSHRLQVSCQNQKDGEGDGKLIDRRNMLLGLGGLYGAANLISTPGQASADPIGAPELDKCHPGRNWNANGQPLNQPCCFKTDPSTEIIDYQLPRRGSYRIRKPAHLLRPDEVDDFKEAIRRMRDLPESDPHSFIAQSRIHCAYCNAFYFQPDTNGIDLQVHHNWLFFPFHRWYIYFFEKICGAVLEKPDFALPYWNWDHPEGMPVPSIFRDTTSPLYDNLRDWENALYYPTKPVVLGGATDLPDDQVVANNIAVMYNEMMTTTSDPTEFMGAPYQKGDFWTRDGEGKSETGSHTNVHKWVGTKRGSPNNPNSSGENLGNFYSAGRDPLFYSHHANVDRLWTIWQGLPTGNNKFIRHSDFLNTQFIFYDENKRLVRVKVQDCVGDPRNMGYVILARDRPWQDYIPPRQTAQARTKRATIKAEKPENVFPLTLDKNIKVQVSKTKKGKADEYLVIENIIYDTSKFVKFDVFVDDEDDEYNCLQKASYAGTFSQLPTKSDHETEKSSLRLRLTDLYEYIDVADDDTVVVTLVPRHEGPGISIGGIRIIENPYI